MSIQSEITRLSGNVSDALDAIEAKGVTIPTGANSDDLATLIGQISGGGGGSITQDQDGYLVLSPDGDLPTLITKTITQNGTYDAEDDNADGYSSVTVNVSGGGGGGGDFFVITCEEEALDKTWQEIHDALQTYGANKVVIFMGADATNKYAAVVGTTSDPEEGEYFVTTEYQAYVFFATSASGYPVWD